MAPNKKKVQYFLNNTKMPKIFKHILRLIGFFQFCRGFFLQLSEKLLISCHLLKNPRKNEIQQEAREKLRIDLLHACETPFGFPKRDSQFVVVVDTSFHSTVYVLLTEHYVKRKSHKEIKNIGLGYLVPEIFMYFV